MVQRVSSLLKRILASSKTGPLEVSDAERGTLHKRIQTRSRPTLKIVEPLRHTQTRRSEK